MGGSELGTPRFLQQKMNATMSDTALQLATAADEVSHIIGVSTDTCFGSRPPSRHIFREQKCS
jgi:hypothetical protein